LGVGNAMVALSALRASAMVGLLFWSY